MHTIKNIPTYFLLLAAAVLFSAGSASAALRPSHGEERLLDTYRRNMTGLSRNSFGLPLVVNSFEQGDKVHVDVYGIFDYPFSSVADYLKVPANWCDIVSLHPNVKACTYRGLPGGQLLTFYPGKKVYQPPDDTRKVLYRYRVVALQPRYLNIDLAAEAGPFGTKDHRMKFEALPLDGGRTFVHVSYAYSDSVALRLATKIYFATLGRGKVGFTVTGTDSNGRPVYIGGPRGALERSAVRYYLAIQTFMDTLRYPEESRFSRRISQWHDLTSRYRKQLFDLSKNEYIAFKTAEHKNQVNLQRQVGTALK
ncbi:MAG: hypothetical protein PHH91_13150 [Desulfuromonadaceae bacterium]|nr:hypothetical protein [Desulfuromonadaceae bacterium]